MEREGLTTLGTKMKNSAEQAMGFQMRFEAAAYR